MTAPAAPIIYTAQSGGRIRVRWRAVDTATDYNVYLDSVVHPTIVDDGVNFSEATGEWFYWWSGEQVGQIFIRVTALNQLAEESAYSNERYLYVDSGADHMDSYAGAYPLVGGSQAMLTNRKL